MAQNASMIPILSPDSLEALNATIIPKFASVCERAVTAHNQNDFQQKRLFQVINKTLHLPSSA